MAVATRTRAAAAQGKKGSSKSDTAVLIGTRKGLWVLRAEPSRRTWSLGGPHFLGSIVHHAVLDPRDRRTLLVAARTGHLGPTIFRSTNLGKSWKEAERPPAQGRSDLLSSPGR